MYADESMQFSWESFSPTAMALLPHVVAFFTGHTGKLSPALATASSPTLRPSQQGPRHHPQATPSGAWSWRVGMSPAFLGAGVAGGSGTALLKSSANLELTVHCAPTGTKMEQLETVQKKSQK